MNPLLQGVTLPLDQYPSDDVLWLILKLSLSFERQHQVKNLTADDEEMYKQWRNRLAEAYKNAKQAEDYENQPLFT